jgi:xanthine dehydrogenase YagR molybdenum-binding subunit
MSQDPTLRIEAALKATGRAIYPGETQAQGMLHAALVESAIAHGEVLSVDGARARALPGFADLVSYDETAVLRASPVTGLIRERKIHFLGQPVALVAAESLLQARTAAAAVRADYRAAPPVTALGQVLDKAFSPTMRVPAESARGDAQAALAEAHLTIRQRFETAVNNHHPMEPHAVVCAWDGDTVEVNTTTQAVFGTRRVIAHAFGLPADNVRVVTRYLGGGFGCKGPLWWPWEMLALLASRRTGRPVRLELTRAQLFTLVGRRQETIQDLALGLDAEGRLTAITHDVLAQTSTHEVFCDSTAAVSRWLYACPNVTTRHRVAATNEPHPIPMRAPGAAPGTFALESALDEAAEALGLDPVALRVLNFADHDQQADKPWSSNSLLECYRVGAERFGWADRPAAGQARDGRWRLGWGMASTCYPVHRQACMARVRIEGDASLLVQCGTQDMGSGTYTALGQTAAEALGIPMDKVTVELGDTWLPEGPYSGGAMVTASFTPAVELAVEQLRASLAGLAVADETSPLSGLSPDDLRFADGALCSWAGNASEPLADLMARLAPQGLEAQGAFTPPETTEFSANGYGAVFVEVGVDPELGEVRVRRVGAAFAAGRIINPLLARSQYVGGLIGGIGTALHEMTTTDRVTGHILGDNFADYLIPVHADMPDFDVAMVDEADPHLPGGVKGIGMLGTAGIQAAIANAVHHAVGRRIRHLPIRLEDILGT